MSAMKLCGMDRSATLGSLNTHKAYGKNGSFPAHLCCHGFSAHQSNGQPQQSHHTPLQQVAAQGGRKGGREGGREEREGGREGEREGGRERGRERGREGGREREREAERERGRKGGREGGRREGRSDKFYGEYKSVLMKQRSKCIDD